jgi:hypothetical protein
MTIRLRYLTWKLRAAAAARGATWLACGAEDRGRAAKAVLRSRY